MPDRARWVLIFSDGTGQRGVREDDINKQSSLTIKSTNIFQMFAAVDGRSGFDAFYDAGLGAPEEGKLGWDRWLRNLWSKATGWGITANIVDCYEALMMRWTSEAKIGFFGFSRGAYTVRCLGGVMGACGIATMIDGKPISRDARGSAAKARRKVAEEAVAVYQIEDKTKRIEAGQRFRARYSSGDVMPDVIGVFDTVKALGLPGVTDVVNPFKHVFHDNVLSERVPFALHALSIDENRKTFAAELWEPAKAGQIIEQRWFPGVHSDIGGGYADSRDLSDVTLHWMLGRLRKAGLDIPMVVTVENRIIGKAHDERTGLGRLWLRGLRSIRVAAMDDAWLCDDIDVRFRELSDYRPPQLGRHPATTSFYTSAN